MESDQSNYEVIKTNQDLFSLPKQLSSLDDFRFRNSEFSGYHAIDPLMEMEYNTFVVSSFYSVIPGEFWYEGNGNIGNEMSGEFVLIENAGKEQLSLCDNKIDEEEMIMGNDHQEIIVTKKDKDNCMKIREEINNNSSSMLSRDAISKYFYMPITQASKELHIGLTLLKKRCRDLGIRRWPHRKLTSLQTLINNIEELKGVGNEMEEKLKDVINVLEKKKKKIEEIPDMKIEEKTKRLRHIRFKTNYKRRRLMSSLPHQLHPSFDTYCTTSTPPPPPHNVEEDDEEIMSLLANYFSYDTPILYH